MRMVAVLVGVALACAIAPPAYAQPDMKKVLRASFPTAETGFDPQAAGDIYSNAVNRVIFDTLYNYDHLARPLKLVPNTAVALPEISADGKTWTIKVKPGIYFADDPVFKGSKRELTANDYVYSWKRILDPRMRANALNAIEGRLVDPAGVLARARETGKLDYDLPIEGLQAVDRYTIRMKLNFPDTELLSNLTTSAFGAVAREVIEAYTDQSGWAMANPVGTGPYRLKEWRRAQKIVLEANPAFREVRYPESNDPADKAIIAKLKGKRIPLIGRVEISIIEEGNPRLLAFQQRELDYVGVPPDLVWNVLDPPATLKAHLAQQGIQHGRGIQPAITYTYFNMEDPVVGGYTPDKIALRRAISMAYNTPEDIKVIRQGQAEPANQVVPPTVTGHNPKLPKRAIYDPAAAKALLDRFGYKDRNDDGFRELPDGKPLVLKFSSSPSAIERQFDELLSRSLNAVGVRVEFNKQKWPDLLKAARLGQLQMFQLGNINTTPEGFGFLGLLYGKHAGFSNLARFAQPDYDRLYEQARGMPHGPDRDTVMQKMGDIVNAYAPWNVTVFRYENVLAHPWVIGYKYNGYSQHPWPYFDIDIARRTAAGK
ncbi:MAG TPA: ABC transporter substrate-binding protein [Casimicrobiaceae bacterium]|nr:ABC transporter substrate-binding protein [Casimicrobiaceae bacterium]